jgi:hypothetical protein
MVGAHLTLFALCSKWEEFTWVTNATEFHLELKEQKRS